MIIGILGGGQLGMMLCQVASKLNIQTFIYSDTDDSPAIKYANHFLIKKYDDFHEIDNFCLLYTSPSPRDATTSRMPSSA